jgi:hypothetical protein
VVGPRWPGAAPRMSSACSLLGSHSFQARRPGRLLRVSIPSGHIVYPILRKLIVRRLVCEAFDDGERRAIGSPDKAVMRQSCPRMFAATNVVTPAGSSRIWTPEFQGVVGTR